MWILDHGEALQNADPLQPALGTGLIHCVLCSATTGRDPGGKDRVGEGSWVRVRLSGADARDSFRSQITHTPHRTQL